MNRLIAQHYFIEQLDNIILLVQIPSFRTCSGWHAIKCVKSARNKMCLWDLVWPAISIGPIANILFVHRSISLYTLTVCGLKLSDCTPPNRNNVSLCFFTRSFYWFLFGFDGLVLFDSVHHYKFAQNEIKHVSCTHTPHSHIHLTLRTHTQETVSLSLAINLFRLICIAFAFFWVAKRFKRIVFVAGVVVTCVCFCHNFSFYIVIVVVVVGGIWIRIVFNQTK